MDPRAIDQLLGALAADDTGWRVDIPPDAGCFLGHPIGLDDQTRHVPEDGPPPPPDESKLALAREVLAGLPRVLAVAEREYTEQAKDWGRDPVGLVRDPHVWLLLDEFEEAGPGRWAFVIGRQDAPDYGTHVEFDRLEFLECWGGD